MLIRLYSMKTAYNSPPESSIRSKVVAWKKKNYKYLMVLW